VSTTFLCHRAVNELCWIDIIVSGSGGGGRGSGSGSGNGCGSDSDSGCSSSSSSSSSSSTVCLNPPPTFSAVTRESIVGFS